MIKRRRVVIVRHVKQTVIGQMSETKQGQLNKTSATASDNVPPEEHSFLFKVNAEGMSLNTSTETFLVDCGATTHIVNHLSLIHI